MYYTYIMASKKDGVLYIGVTRELAKRIFEHKEGITGGFTSKYKVHKLVYFEEYDSIENAILREKELKHFKRQWKIELIEKDNPDWNDLYELLF